MVWVPTAARADCVQTGTTVTCAPPGTGGFTAGVQNGLSVTVQSGATASTTTPATAAITINNTSTLVNNGTIGAASNGAGIAATNSNSITNNSAIGVGDNGTGIFTADGNTVTNNGTITAGISGNGIAVNSGNTVYNYGTISVGQSGNGVEFGTNTNTFYNYGTVRAVDGFSIEACFCGAANNTVNNYGTLDGTLQLFGSGNVINNYGLITTTGDDGTVGSNQHFIKGTFNQFAGGILELRVTALGANDSLAADTLNLAGTLRLAVRPGLYGASTTYSDLLSNQTFGPTNTSTFTSIVSSSPFFTVTPIYDTADPAAWAVLSAQLNRIPFGSVPGATGNQRAVGNVLEPGYSTSLTGTLATFYSNLLAATSLSALDQLSGAGTAATQNSSFGAAGLFNGAMMQQGLAWLSGAAGSGGFGAPLQYAADDNGERKPGYDAFAAMQPHAPKAPEWRAWALGFGSTRSIDGDSGLGTADQSLQTAGGAFGVERTVGSDWLFGFAAGGSSSSFSVASLSTSGHVDGGHFGAYGVMRWGDAYALATLNYARFDNSTDRTITGVGPTETAHGSFASDELGGRFELGWRRRIAGYAVTPFVAIEPAALWQHAYSETSTTAGGGAGMLGLNYAARETTSLPTFVGAQLDGRYAFDNGQTVQPFVRAAWVHEFMPQRQIAATFISIPTASFTVDGARPASDAARFSGGATWSIDASKAIFARIDSEVSGSGAMVAGTAGARITW